MSSYDSWLEGPYTDGDDSCFENPDCIHCWSECEECDGLGTLDGVECNICEGEGSIFTPASDEDHGPMEY